MGRKMTAAERDTQRAKVVQLRSVRLTFREIGQRLTPPVSAQRAHDIYEAALIANPLTAVQVDEHRLEALELADVAIRQLMAIGAEPAHSTRTRVEAWSSMRAWEEHRARITGVYAPTRREVLTIDVIDAQIAALEAELGVRADLDKDGLSAEIAALEAQLATESGPGGDDGSAG
jgi:hypothetical protein